MTLIRDNSTGKLARDSVSGKLQRKQDVSWCPYCVSTPATVALTLNNLVECPCLSFTLPDRSYKPVGVVDILNGSTYFLPLFGQPWGHSCGWSAIVSGYFGALRHYTYANCTGAYDIYPIERLMLAVERCISNSVRIAVVACAWFVSEWRCFDVYRYSTWNPSAVEWDCKAATITDCIGVTNLANQLTCGSTYPDPPLCDSGSGTVVESPTGFSFSQYRVPTGDASLQWSPVSNNYALVDDPPSAPDDDDSYTYTETGWDKDYFNFPAFNIPAGSTITSVVVTGRFKRIWVGGSYLARLLIRVNGITYYGPSEQFVIGAYFTRTATWTTNPATGLAWTIDDINGIGSNPLQNFGYECMGFQKRVRCTQVYTKVNYSN